MNFNSYARTTYRVKISYTPLYYPRADPTERVNAVVKTMIATTVKDDHRRWADNLAAVGCAIRTSRHETTGYSPYFANFGREHQLYGHDADHDLSDEPENLGDTVRKRQEGYKRMYQDIVGKLAKDFARNKMTYDLRPKPVYYVLGPKFVGPFVITRKCGARTYELADKQGIKSRVWHAQDLKPVNDTFIALSAGPEDYRNRVSP